MKNLLKTIPFFLLLSIIFVSCGSDVSEKEKVAEDVKNSIDDIEGASADLKDALKGVVESVKSGDNSNVEIVNHRKLKEFLPESMAGMDRVSSEGQTGGAFGIKVSTSEARYGSKKSREPHLEVTIVDTGGLGASLMATVPWATMEMDKESDNGYERTSEYKGHKSFEKYNASSEKGSIAVLVEKRYLVTIEGRGITEKQLKNAIDEINIKKLARLES